MAQGSTATGKMLGLNNISLDLGGRPIIRDIDFDVLEGEIVCLLGPSGCGKTSTLRLIAGLEKPDAGTITINGKTVSSHKDTTPPHKRGVGFLFQDFALFPHLTVAENISYGLTGLDREAAAARVDELLAQIQLTDHADKYPHMLSGGEQQRVALARARAPRPRLLLLDEPFSGQDTALRQQLRNETLNILKDRGATAIMVTHDPEEAMMMADRIILMKDGRVVQNGTPSEIYHRPATSFAAQFFGDINRLPGKVENGRVKTGLGEFAEPSLKDGSDVEVLIRPDSMKIVQSNDPDCSLHVCAVRDAGNASLVRLGIGDWREPHAHIHVRHRGPARFEHGDPIGVEIDPDQVFIFEN